jgi:DNA-binding CsgD family transcriptional regulator
LGVASSQRENRNGGSGFACSDVDCANGRQVDRFHALGFTSLVDGAALSLSVYRLRVNDDFDEAQIALMEAIEPHVVRARAVARRLLQAQQARAAAEGALDRLPSAIVLLDERGRPRFINSAAQRILRSREGLWCDSDGVRAATPDATARLHALIARIGQLAARRCPAGGGVISLPRPSSLPPLSVLAAPLPATAHLAATTRSSMLLLLRDPTAEPCPVPARLEHLYGLTPAEARLAARLAAGESLDEAAATLGVTRETVRSQLRGVFHKTDTRRQGKLLRKLTLDTVLLLHSPDAD